MIQKLSKNSLGTSKQRLVRDLSLAELRDDCVVARSQHAISSRWPHTLIPTRAPVLFLTIYSLHPGHCRPCKTGSLDHVKGKGYH